jgi:hypothetical protein
VDILLCGRLSYKLCTMLLISNRGSPRSHGLLSRLPGHSDEAVAQDDVMHMHHPTRVNRNRTVIHVEKLDEVHAIWTES